ncbi:Pycsar system effector family protein [Micromonospora sp. NPDC005237]|uniref:Pycsar system effector family protein n=1 Tax=unclassified Micromonospora TaxID=2617518 RepID=UPI0033AE8F6A
MEEQRLAERLLAHNREEIDRADGKAVHGLAIAGTAVGAAVGFVLGGAGSRQQLGSADSWFWWAASALWIVGTVSLLLALYPRVRGDRDDGQVAFFGHVGTLDRGQLTAALRQAATQPLVGLISELHWTSRIVIVKYRFIRWGLACLCLSFVSLAALTF